MNLYGMKVVSHPHALERKFEVQRHPIKKRRRNWRVVSVIRPSCFIAMGTIYMHPELFAKLPRIDQ